MYTCPPDLACVLHLLYIVIWKPGCPCVAVCVCVCCSKLACGPTPWLKCVHASLHVFMSTWVQNSGTPPLHSYMETWVPGCGTVCMFQSVHFWSHTLLRMCKCRKKMWDHMIGDWDTNMGSSRGTHACSNYVKGVGQIWGVRWTCLHVLMHIHIKTKV